MEGSELIHRNQHEKITFLFERINDLIKQSRRIIIHTHKLPDFDAFASVLMAMFICMTLNPQASIEIDENTLKEIASLNNILGSINPINPGIPENANTTSAPLQTLNIVLDTHPQRVASNENLVAQQGSPCIVIDHHINDYGPHSNQDQVHNNVYYIQKAPSNTVLLYKIWQEIRKVNKSIDASTDKLMFQLAVLGLVGDNASETSENITKLIPENIGDPSSLQYDITSLLNVLNPKLPDELVEQIEQKKIHLDITIGNDRKILKMIYISITESNVEATEASNQDLLYAVKKLGDILKSLIANTSNDPTRPTDDILLIVYSEKGAILKIISHSGTNWNDWLRNITEGKSGGHGNDAAWTVQFNTSDSSQRFFSKLKEIIGSDISPNILFSYIDLLKWFHSILKQQQDAIHSFLGVDKNSS